MNKHVDIIHVARATDALDWTCNLKNAKIKTAHMPFVNCVATQKYRCPL